MADADSSLRPANPATTELLLALAREKLSAQEHAWEAQRTKAGFILAADVLAIPYLHDLSLAGRGSLLPLLVLAIAGAGGFAIAAIWPREVVTGGNITKYLRDRAWQDPKDVLPHLATHYAYATDKNEETFKAASRALKFALGLLAAALALFIALMTSVS